jgi:hypothetical protein
MSDHWVEKLYCPQCKVAGLVSLSQSRFGEIPIIDEISSDFKTMHTEFGPIFHCGACDTPVAPSRNIPALAQ